jgi:hypothetical protein
VLFRSVNEPTAASAITPGTRIINVPKYTAMAELNYETTVSPGIRGAFRLASSLVGPVDDIAYYRETLPLYNIINARIGAHGGAWAAYLVGTNLTNKLAQLTIDNTTFAWQQPTITRVTTNQPRTIGVDLQYRF